jgi:hypothetical protein
MRLYWGQGSSTGDLQPPGWEECCSYSQLCRCASCHRWGRSPSRGEWGLLQCGLECCGQDDQKLSQPTWSLLRQSCSWGSSRDSCSGSPHWKEVSLGHKGLVCDVFSVHWWLDRSSLPQATGRDLKQQQPWLSYSPPRAWLLDWQLHGIHQQCPHLSHEDAGNEAATATLAHPQEWQQYCSVLADSEATEMALASSVPALSPSVLVQSFSFIPQEGLCCPAAVNQAAELPLSR